MAGRNPEYVHRKMAKPLIEREAHMEWIKTGQRYYVKDNQGLPRGGKVFTPTIEAPVYITNLILQEDLIKRKRNI